ncbi:recombinase family protein [Streptomyces ochraceiscleroticus]
MRLRWGPFAKVYKENDASAFNSARSSAPTERSTGLSCARSSGESAYAIAKRFNVEGIKPPEALTWSSNMINKMLRNPRYAGMVTYGGRRRGRLPATGAAYRPPAKAPGRR